MVSQRGVNRMSTSVAFMLTFIFIYLTIVCARVRRSPMGPHQYEQNVKDGEIVLNGFAGLPSMLMGSGLPYGLGDGPMKRNLSSVWLTAAVVAPASSLSDVGGGPSAFTKDRYSQGLRVALITGAPWLLLTGTARECEEGTEYLRRVMETSLADLFVHGNHTQFGGTLAATGNRSVRAWKCLLNKEHGTSVARAGRVPAVLHRRGSVELFGDEDRLRATLDTNSATAHLPDSTKNLAALLVAERLRASSGLDMNGHGQRATAPETSAHGFEALSTLATPWADGAVTPQDRWRYPRVWTVDDGGECEFSDEPRQPGSSVSVVLPGIVPVILEREHQEGGAEAVAGALRALVEHSLVSRLYAGPPHRDTAWLSNGSYNVIVLAGEGDEQRVRLQHRAALRRMRAKARDDLRSSVQAALSAIASADRSSLAVTTSWPSRSSWMASLSTRESVPRVYVHPAGERLTQTMLDKLPPVLTYDEYVGKLEEARNASVDLMNPNGKAPIRVSLLTDDPPPPQASMLALELGRYSHYLYYTYCRFMSSVLIVFLTHTPCNFFSLAHDLAIDVADGRIDWLDFVFD